MSIKIQMMNLGHGEASLVLLDSSNEKIFNLLIDGGSEKASKDGEGNAIKNQKVIDLLNGKKVNGIVVSHIDDDHIGGIIRLLRNKILEQNHIIFFLFNKYVNHKISFPQAERLEQLLASNLKGCPVISSYKARYIDENKAIYKKTLLDEKVIESKILSVHTRMKMKVLNRNILYLTILAPNQDDINSFMQKWKEYKNAKSNEAGRYPEIINDASIVTLLEYDDKKVIFTGDSKIEKIMTTLNLLSIDLNGIKLCHHGAFANNVKVLDLLKNHNCKTIFYSTNSKNYYQHPDVGLLHNIILGIPDVTIYATNQLTSEMIERQLKEYKKENLEGYFYVQKRQNTIVVFVLEEFGENMIENVEDSIAKIMQKIVFKRSSKTIVEEVLQKYMELNPLPESEKYCVDRNVFMKEIAKILETEISNKINVVEEGELIEL